MMRRIPLLATCAMFLAGLGCATSSAFRAGEKAERLGDFDRATLEYSKAVKEKPEWLDARLALQRARRRSAEEHLTQGRRMAARGLYKDALDEYQLALDLDGSQTGLVEEMEGVRRSRNAGLMPKSVTAIKQSARERSLPGLEIEPALDTPMGFKFEGADVKEAYKTLGLVVGVNFVFESGVVPSPVTLEMKDAPFEQALKAVSMASKTFTRVIGPKLIQVIPDTPSKRRDYEDQIVKTFYLSSADLKEVVDVLRISLGARRVAPLAGGNALTINDTPEKVAAAERIIESLDKRHGEVVVEVEILEVNRQKMLDYGIEINSISATGVITPGILGGAFPDPTKVTTLESEPYKKSNIIVSGLPGVVYRLLRTDGSSRLLANPQLRVSEGQTATARFGDQVPVPVTTFAAIATGGVAQQPITSFEYKNVGINIDVTPRVHQDGDITLQLKLEISQVGAPGFGGLPTFNNRTVTSVLRLRDGETNILAGLINDRESTSLSGLPGISSIPIIGRIFGRTQKEATETDIIMTLSPRILYKPEFSETDMKSFSVGSDSSPLLFEVPPAVQPVMPPQAPPVLLPTPMPRPEPIRAPAPAPTPTPHP
ncbi:MAG TPA: secretin N-terminal domain-containing protein [Vicinamibacteria bacterium]|nr:secretin N-terminal domain-containing protein [Vicinamibacteria bacterium]HRB11711.1 secretin N-terminal domain-containing protein [Vicinamibacteria bacterium]